MPKSMNGISLKAIKEWNLFIDCADELLQQRDFGFVYPIQNLDWLLFGWKLLQQKQNLMYNKKKTNSSFRLNFVKRGSC